MTTLTARFARIAGFTIVELLVALMIGTLGSLAIMQVFTSSEANRRATGSMATTQSNALIGLFSIERDLQQAGMGMTDLRVFGCNILVGSGPTLGLNGAYMQPAVIVPANVGINDAANLWSIPPGDANSDMLLIAYARAANMMEGSPLTRATASPPYRLTNVLGIGLADNVMVAQSGKQCTIGQIVNVNQATEEVTPASATSDSYTTSAYAFNLGATPRLVVYAVRNGALTLCDFTLADCSDATLANDTTVWQPVVNDVVALVAQYGWDTSSPPDMIADTFCKTRLTAGSTCPAADSGSPGAGNSSLTQTQRSCDWTRIPAIRVGLVMRSGQYEKTEVSPVTLELWPDSLVVPTTNGPIYTVPDRHYRYRVAYTTVALRNVIWLGAQSTC